MAIPTISSHAFHGVNMHARVVHAASIRAGDAGAWVWRIDGIARNKSNYLPLFFLPVSSFAVL